MTFSPTLVHGYDIHIPFDKDTICLSWLSPYAPGTGRTARGSSVYGRFRRIDIFRYILVLAQRAASKASTLPERPITGYMTRPLKRSYMRPSSVRILQAGIYRYLVRESGPCGQPQKQVVGTVYGIAQVEALYRGIVYAALPEIAQSDVTAIVGVRKDSVQSAPWQIRWPTASIRARWPPRALRRSSLSPLSRYGISWPDISMPLHSSAAPAP